MGSLVVLVFAILYSTEPLQAQLPTISELGRFYGCIESGRMVDLTAVKHLSEVDAAMPPCVAKCPAETEAVENLCVTPETPYPEPGSAGIKLGITLEYVCPASQDCAWLDDGNAVAVGFRLRLAQLFHIPLDEFKGAQFSFESSRLKLEQMYVVREGEQGFLSRRLNESKNDIYVYMACRADTKRLRAADRSVLEVVERNATVLSWFLGLPITIFNASLHVGGLTDKERQYQLIYVFEGHEAKSIALATSPPKPTTAEISVTTSTARLSSTSTVSSTGVSSTRLDAPSSSSTSTRPAVTIDGAEGGDEDRGLSTSLLIGLCILGLIFVIILGLVIRKHLWKYLFKPSVRSQARDADAKARANGSQSKSGGWQDRVTGNSNNEAKSAANSSGWKDRQDRVNGNSNIPTRSAAYSPGESADADVSYIDEYFQRAHSRGSRGEGNTYYNSDGRTSGKTSAGKMDGGNPGPGSARAGGDAGRAAGGDPGTAKTENTKRTTDDSRGSRSNGDRHGDAPGGKSRSSRGGGAAKNSPQSDPVGKCDDDNLDIFAVDVELEDMRSKGTPLSERKRFFQQLLLKWHPDKNPEAGDECTKVFQHLQDRKDWFLSDK